MILKSIITKEGTLLASTALPLFNDVEGDGQPENYASPVLNRLDSQDHPFHNWYRFVLSFPAHLVRDYLSGVFGLSPGAVVLDPFCGTGTTAIEARLLGYHAIGIEANPMAHFASSVKTDWRTTGPALREWAEMVAERANERIANVRKLRTLSEEENALLLRDSISPVPLHKVLMLKEAITQQLVNAPEYRLGLLALAKTAVQTASNLHFGPEVGVRGRKEDAPVVDAWLKTMRQMARDIELVADAHLLPSQIHRVDARAAQSLIATESVDAVFTSPPYPNEKDYTRTTRLESVLLGFLHDKKDLRVLKQSLVRSNTRNVYKDDDDDAFIAHHPQIQEIAAEIESRRIKLNKTSGFEKLYARVTRLYFGGMARHLETIKPLLKSGAKLGYVVGDQASYFRVHIPTGEILAQIAVSLGYRHVRTDLFRTRLATATKQQIREEIVLLER